MLSALCTEQDQLSGDIAGLVAYESRAFFIEISDLFHHPVRDPHLVTSAQIREFALMRGYICFAFVRSI